ncbi:hypothetical protein IWQ60_009626 [Tieghemiomyces parasiticus]|uniref:rRNA-processing protein efg1 n=1 Tax=Tieghemiomyces parasiticus TaxID=78921 RepID=A0A9W7ZVL4_9FUNG|nr:hypothetical protein IWQ60_009626 [Tieghemiomyces parasiticus]
MVRRTGKKRSREEDEDSSSNALAVTAKPVTPKPTDGSRKPIENETSGPPSTGPLPSQLDSFIKHESTVAAKPRDQCAKRPRVSNDKKVETVGSLQREVGKLQRLLNKAEYQRNVKRESAAARQHQFYDRKKVTKELQKVELELAEEGSSLDDEARAQLETKRADLQVDLHYIEHFPPAKPYISIRAVFGKKKAGLSAARSRIREEIHQATLNNTLASLQDQRFQAFVDQRIQESDVPDEQNAPTTQAAPALADNDDFFAI